MKKQLLFPILLVFFANIKVHAEFIPEGIAAPEAANLGIVSNIPVSHYTGQANISIPLFDLQTYKYPVHVNLNYNSSGFRPNLLHGWTGQNWDLEVGGVITRTVKGIPDETREYGAYYSYKKIYEDNYVGSEFQHYDTEPDVFSFHANGISGKFCIGKDGKFIVLSQPGIIVEESPTFKNIYNSAGKFAEMTFYGFTITTSDGTKYEFGMSENLIETTVSFTGDSEPGPATATAWYLSSITLFPSGEKIDFSYSSKKRDVFYSREEYNAVNQWWYQNFQINHNSENCRLKDGTLLTASFMDHIYLKSVESSIFKLDFYTSNANYYQYPEYPDKSAHNWQKLDSVRLTSKYLSKYIKSVHFSYDNNNGTGKRLFLKSVKESGKPPYEFDYYEKQSISGVPYDSKQIDHWGFYNGYLRSTFQYHESNLKTLMTKDFYENRVLYYYLNRESDPGHSQWGMLKDIQYPTGAKQTFEYESHEYSKYSKYDPFTGQMSAITNPKSWSEWKYLSYREPFSFTTYNTIILIAEINARSAAYTTNRIELKLNAGRYTDYHLMQHTDIPYGEECEFRIAYRELKPDPNSYAGGSRIKKVIQKDNDKEIVKEYKYIKKYIEDENNTLSSGILACKPSYKDIVSERPNDNGTITQIYSTIQSHSYSPSELTKGSHIGYSEVTEITKDAYNNILGSTVYKYTDMEYYNDRSPLRFRGFLEIDLGVRSSQDIKRGNITSETVYNSQKKIVSEKNYKYIYSVREGLFAKYIRRLPVASSCVTFTGNSPLCMIDYLLDHDSFLQQEVRYDSYDTNGNHLVREVITYKYNEYDQLTEEVKTVNDNSKIKTKFTYPIDYKSIEPYTNLINRNILSPIIEKQIYTNDSFLMKEVNEYKNYSGKPVLYRVLKQTKEQTSPYIAARYEMYDLYYNPVYVILNETENFVFLWSNGQFLNAEIKNTTGEEVENLIGVNAYRDWIVNMEEVDVLRGMLPNSLVTTYHYLPCIGLQSVNDPSGIKTIYEYDSFYRLKQIKDSEGNVIQTFKYNYKK